VVARASPVSLEKKKYLVPAGNRSSIPRPYLTKPVFVIMPVNCLGSQLTNSSYNFGTPREIQATELDIYFDGKEAQKLSRY
jgi:hypothetical protein